MYPNLRWCVLLWAGLVGAAPTHLSIPKNGAYAGAYVDFGETEDTVTVQAIRNFESLVEKPLAIVAFSSYWGKRSFPKEALQAVGETGSVPLIFWSPWDPPYQEAQSGKPAKTVIQLQDVLNGKFDAYIDQWANDAKAYEKPLLVSWGLEMNGEWFPWSGVFQGGSKTATNCVEPCTLGPKTYQDAYRYLVNRVRARGAKNIAWVFHANGNNLPDASWNRMAAYYPGPEYVDWLALSVYGKQFVGEEWSSAEQAMDGPYQEISKVDTKKPILIAEWGVADFPKSGSKAEYIRDALKLMSSRYSRVKGAIFWHERWENEDETVSNLYVNSSKEALDAYKTGIANPFWIDHPVFE